MNRSSQHEAVVLRHKPFGESHALVDLLSPQLGLYQAVAYGVRSRRGSLRGKVVPFARGRAFLYRNPRQERYKLSDFDPHAYLHAAHTDLGVYYHASLWAEVVVRTYASGDRSEAAYALLCDGYTTLAELVRTDAVTLVACSAVVLWRYLDLLGLRPTIPPDSAAGGYYVPDESEIVASAGGHVGAIALTAEALRFLRSTESGSVAEVIATAPDRPALAGVRRVVLNALQAAIGAPLHTPRVGRGYV